MPLIHTYIQRNLYIQSIITSSFAAAKRIFIVHRWAASSNPFSSLDDLSYLPISTLLQLVESANQDKVYFEEL